MEQPVALILEDESAMRQLIELIFNEKGYTSVSAETAKEGVVLFHQYCQTLKLVLFDVRLKGEETGCDFHRAVAPTVRGKRITFVAMTGGCTVDDETYLHLQGVPIIQKPFKWSKLLNLLESAINVHPHLS